MAKIMPQYQQNSRYLQTTLYQLTTNIIYRSTYFNHYAFWINIPDLLKVCNAMKNEGKSFSPFHKNFWTKFIYVVFVVYLVVIIKYHA
jgi:hypothetical protein